MSSKLVEWLTIELEERNWSMRELARRAGLASSTVTDIMNYKTNPGFEFCRSVAQALNAPTESVLRLAGLIPPEPEETADLKEALHLFNQLSPERRKYILTTMRALASGTPAPAPKASR